VGRLALMPSVHVFGLWRLHHDIHHRYTCLRGRDYVWTPLTVVEFQTLSPWRQRLHRLYRHRSGVGLGVHYAIEIWAPRMLWPRARHGLKMRGRLLVDTLILYGSLGAMAGAAWGVAASANPERPGLLGFWVTAGLLLFVVPLLATQWMIGFVIYLNHTHPDVVWYADTAEWERHPVQLESSTSVRFSPWRHWFLPRRIMDHTAHHVDPGVPLRRLRRVQERLIDTAGDRMVSYRWSARTFRDVLSRCKLYDYEAQQWLTYTAVEDRPA
ncbi:MAG: fatty acid desaturase, partial [Acidimicrobiia bacterium]|nr:fatty acid desaturase [Acidimicrobiia bacterium]